MIIVLVGLCLALASVFVVALIATLKWFSILVFLGLLIGAAVWFGKRPRKAAP